MAKQDIRDLLTKFANFFINLIKKSPIIGSLLQCASPNLPLGVHFLVQSNLFRSV